MAGKKAGKIGRGLLWLAAGILLLTGICFFAFTMLVYQGQLPFGYQITLVEQSDCDIPLTNTLVLTRQQDSYASGDSVLFFRQEGEQVRADCGTLQQLEEGLGVVDQSGAVAYLSGSAVTGKILLCFPTLGRIAVWINGPVHNTLLFWVCIGLGVLLLAVAALLLVSALSKKEKAPLSSRSRQAGYQPQPEPTPVKLFFAQPEESAPSSVSPQAAHYPDPEQLEDLPWRKYATQENVPLHKEPVGKE